MVTILATEHTKVQRELTCVAERAHPVLEERARNRASVERPSADVDDRLHERIVHRNGALPVSRGAVRHERGNGLANG